MAQATCADSAKRRPAWQTDFGKSIPSGKTRVIRRVRKFVKVRQLVSRVNGKIMQFGAGCTDYQAEICPGYVS